MFGKRKFIKSIVLLGIFCITLGLSSCEDDDVSNRDSTIQSVMVGDYLENNPEIFSEFTKLVKDAGMFTLLNAYGVYTCFIPTNEALLKYYEDNLFSYNQLSDSMKIVIVQNHIISGKIDTEPLETVKFPIGSISSPNMNNNFIRAGTDKFATITGDTIIAPVINDAAVVIASTSRSIRDDDYVHNGIIHTINKALESPGNDIAEALIRLTDYTLFAEALALTAIGDSLTLKNNDDYISPGRVRDLKPSGSGLMDTPAFCKYGYTIFMEKDGVFAENEIHSITDLIKYAEEIYYDLFPLRGSAEEQARVRADYTDRNNALNRFVSYHIMDRMMDANEFIPREFTLAVVTGTTIREYYEMMMPNSLIEIQTGNIINKHIGSATNDPNDVKVIGNAGSLEQVMFLEINNILTYKDVENKVLNKRLRMDITSMIGEFSTNKLRNGYPYYIVPKEFFSNHSKVSFTEETQFQHIAMTSYYNMYSDELLFVGKYDFSIQTPPIPPGRWEVRFSYTPNTYRGVAQIFLNGKPCGIPLDLRIVASNAKIGWVADSPTDESVGLENDKMMRNRGYMKGPNTIKQVSGGTILRNFAQSLRRIVDTVDLEEAQPVTLRIKSVMDNTRMEFMIDYMEFVPSTYLENEGKD